jgi:hypothetical protein
MISKPSWNKITAQITLTSMFQARISTKPSTMSTIITPTALTITTIITPILSTPPTTTTDNTLMTIQETMIHKRPMITSIC